MEGTDVGNILIMKKLLGDGVIDGLERTNDKCYLYPFIAASPGRVDTEDFVLDHGVDPGRIVALGSKTCKAGELFRGRISEQSRRITCARLF